MFALLFLMQTAPAVPPAQPEEIVVMGRRLERLRRLKMVTRIDRKTGITHCIFKRRSGDPALDASVCAATLACVPKVRTMSEMRECITPAMDALVSNQQWSATPD